jgi:hypothetical protein
METDRIIIGGLLVIILIVAINAAMYGIVRGMTRGGNSNWLNTIRKSLDKPLEGSVNKSMDELRRKIEELEGHKNKEEK